MARFFLLSILSILLFAFFCWGYFTKKNSIFPYPIIKITKLYIWPDHYSLLETNQKTRSEMILLDIKQNRLKYKYNKWETLKPNEFLFQFKKIIKKNIIQE